MIWVEHVGASRALTAACWLGTAIVVHSWRLPFAAVAAAIGKRRAGRVRMAPVSSAWLREYEADCVKHDEAR